MRSMVDDIMVHEIAIHVSRVGVVFRSFIVGDIYQCPVNRDLEGSSLLAHKTNQINKGTFKQFFFVYRGSILHTRLVIKSKK
jgi:hypothetical protein